MLGSNWSRLRFFVICVYIFMFAPLCVVMLLSFNASTFGTFPIQDYTLHWFGNLSRNHDILSAFKTSVILGVITAITATVLSTMLAMAVVRYNLPFYNVFQMIVLSPLLIPEVVLGVALLLFIRFINLDRSFLLLVIGHTIVVFPYAYLVIQARMYSISRSYEDAARSLGASPISAFVRVTIPLLAPALFAALLFGFTISFDDVTHTLFWIPPGQETVPVEIYSMLRTSITPEINALGTLMILITVLIPLAAGYLSRRFIGDDT